MNKLWIVATETYKRNVKSIGFLVMILTPFIILAIGGIFGYMMNQTNQEKTVAIIGEEAYRTSFISGKHTFSVDQKITTVEQAQASLKAEDIDGYFVISQENDKLKGKLFITSSDEKELETVLGQQLNIVQATLVAKQLNLTSEQLAALSTPAVFEKQTLKFDGDKITEEADDKGMFLMLGALVTSIFIFMFIMNYSSIIGQEIASEKGTRIMEIILSSTRASTHFYGKLVGICLVCLTQVVAYIFMGGITYLVTANNSFVKDALAGIPVKELVQGLFGYNMFFFIFGILSYIAISAFLGSLVTKTEDVAKSIQPIVFIGLAGFYIGMFLGQSNPEHIAVKVSSYVPLLSSFVMPFRLASGTVSTIGVLISLAILIVTTIGVILLSATLYRSNVLIYSDGGMWKTFKQSLNILKNEKKSI